MTEKKEILEYLRNLQKAAEIEAKVNGINLWVLLGALAIVFWQLLTYADYGTWRGRELMLQVIIGCEAAYLMFRFCSLTAALRDDLRYVVWNRGDTPSPGLIVAEGIWIFIPPLLLFELVGMSFSVFYLGLLGLLSITVGLGELLALVKKNDKSSERFPKPNFRVSTRASVGIALVFGSGFLLVIVQQVSALWIAAPISIEIIKSLALLAALYMLCMAIIRRRISSDSIRWTYELEMHVLLGSVSPEVALRRIEHRALGPRLEDVMTKFFDDLDRGIDEFEASLGGCEKRLESLKEVPTDFQAERADRITKATTKEKAKLGELQHEVNQLSTYLQNLEKRKSDERIAGAIENLAAKKKLYAARILKAKESFEDLVKTVQAP